METIETGTQTLTQNIGRQITPALMGTWVPESVGVCRDCGASLRPVALRRSRSVTGIFGDYEWARSYMVCPKGHGSDAPQDRVLKLGPGQASPKLVVILARLAIELPFDQVPDVVAQTLGLEVGGEMVRRVTEKIGSWAESQEQTAIQAAQCGNTPAPSAPVPSTLLMALDGAMVNTKRLRDDHWGWHEGKVGVCARFEPTPPPLSGEKNDAPPTNRRTIVWDLSRRRTSWPVYMRTPYRPGWKIPRVTKSFSWPMGITGFGSKARNTDAWPGRPGSKSRYFYHASQHIWAVAKAVWPQDDAAQHAWVDDVLHRLRHDGILVHQRYLNAALRGFYQYFGYPGCLPGLNTLRQQVLYAWYQVLRRRSQRSPQGFAWYHAQGWFMAPVPKLRPRGASAR